MPCFRWYRTASGAQRPRLKDLYQFGHLERAEYLQKRGQIEDQLAQQAPAPSRALDIERAAGLLGDLPALLDAATPLQRRALIQQVLTMIWIEKRAVTAVKPAANFLLLVQAGINGDLGGSRPRASKVSARVLARLCYPLLRRWADPLPEPLTCTG
jgi:hypothetical protein